MFKYNQRVALVQSTVSSNDHSLKPPLPESNYFVNNRFVSQPKTVSKLLLLHVQL